LRLCTTRTGIMAYKNDISFQAEELRPRRSRQGEAAKEKSHAHGTTLSVVAREQTDRITWYTDPFPSLSCILRSWLQQVASGHSAFCCGRERLGPHLCEYSLCCYSRSRAFGTRRRFSATTLFHYFSPVLLSRWLPICYSSPNNTVSPYPPLDIPRYRQSA
jgi:hypothetical protein